MAGATVPASYGSEGPLSNSKDDLPEYLGEPNDLAPDSIIAYRTHPWPMRLVPAASTRRWMNETTDRFANRCLPLKIANQAGWFLLNERPFRATWDGANQKSSVRVEPLDGSEEHLLANSQEITESLIRALSRVEEHDN